MAPHWGGLNFFFELAPDLDTRHLEIYEKPKNRDSKWSDPLKNQFIATLFRYDLSAAHPKIFIFLKIVPFENYLLEQCILGT